MTPAYEDRWVTIHGGENRAIMRALPERSVHTVVTSPPYWGLRDYGLPPSVWGGDPDHDHVFGAESGYSGHRGSRGQVAQTKHAANDTYPQTKHQAQGATSLRAGRSNVGEQRSDVIRATASGACECGAWEGQLGLEPSPEEYVAHLVEVMREVHRVLRDDGTLWLNIGDTYWSTGGAGGTMSSSGLVGGAKRQGPRPEASDPERFGRWNRRSDADLKPKDLIGIPWMAAFALRADGWYLRSDIVWAKPNAMPESVEDRPARSHEFMFLLAKSEAYYYDHVAVKEALRYPDVKGIPFGGVKQAGGQNVTYSGRIYDASSLGGRNLRDVWSINTEPYPGSHFATYPRKLVEPCVRAGTSERGVCAACGAPWERVTVEEKREPTDAANGIAPENGARGTRAIDPTGRGGNSLSRVDGDTIGWAPTCDHGGEPVPATVLDPFAGTGTTLVVAQTLGRRALGIDLNPDYLRQCLARSSREWGVGGRILEDTGEAEVPEDSIWAAAP